MAAKQALARPQSQSSGSLTVDVPFFGAGAGEFAHPLLVCAKGAGVALVDDPAVVQHVGAIGDLDRRTHVLLDQQDREAFGAALLRQRS